VTGLDRLRDFGLEMYADLDPLAAPSIAPGRVEEPASDPESLILALPLPGVAQEDVRLARSGEVVLVTVGPHRRSLTLPPHLRHRVATGARITDGQLEVEFAR
jgi:arsenite/tail-anchored protein-transporting ATPase